MLSGLTSWQQVRHLNWKLCGASKDPTGAQVALDEANQKITVSDLTPEQGFASLTLSDGTDTYDVGGDAGSTWDPAGFDTETLSGTYVITYADWWKDWIAK